MADDGSALVLSFKDGLDGNAAVAQSLQLAAFCQGSDLFAEPSTSENSAAVESTSLYVLLFASMVAVRWAPW